MKILISILFVIVSNNAFAGLNTSFIDASVGYPFDVSIENPDGSMAYYDGAAFKSTFHYSYADSRSETSYGITFHYKYLNLENTKKTVVTESATHKGFGLGVFAKTSGFYLGLNYSFMKAAHQSSGNVSALDEFSYNPLSVDFSYTVPYGNLVEIGPGITYTFTDFTKKETGLSKDSPYSEQIVWLKILFYFK